MPAKLSHIEFITKAIRLHGDRFDYSKSNYVSAKVPITIICKLHGQFQQTPDNHFSTDICCPRCVSDHKSQTTALDTRTFVDNARTVHGYRYDYSKVKYVGNKTNVTIICSDHGPFQQRPSNHLNGKGCSICKTDRLKEAFTETQEDWINRASTIHQNNYDYSVVEYTNSLTKVNIICPDHGKFEQIPSAHVRGQGCPKCMSRISDPSQQWLDSLNLPDTPACREVKRLIPGKRYIVDGYDPSTKTVYEFHGDYWHGNPTIFAPNQINPHCKTTFGRLYEKTLQKRQDFLDAGFHYVEMWESEWRRWVEDLAEV